MNPSDELHKFVHPDARNCRILHIGNIANNGYNIANLLNQAGVKSDLIIGPYYHIAGCPEWEDSEFDGEIGDQFYPQWHNVKITNGFIRPKWAAQGSWEICIKYLLNKNRGNLVRAKLYWKLLEVTHRFAVDQQSVGLVNIVTSPRLLIAKGGLFLWQMRNNIYLLQYHCRKKAIDLIASTLNEYELTRPIYRWLRKRNREKIKERASGNGSSEVQTAHDKGLVSDDETEKDLLGHRLLVNQLKPLFEFYDVVIGYSTDGIWPLLAGKKYIAYEHGTIRTIPFSDTAQGRICKLVYQNANSTIISNFDCNVAAEKLGLKNYTCIPHYINEMDVPPENGLKIRKRLCKAHDANFILYNPSRQHWTEKKDGGWEKGNDILITGLAKFIHEVNKNTLAIFTNWGESVEASKSLIASFRIEKNVIWVEPVPHKQMIEYIIASDVVSDQFLLGTFGGIPAKAFMHGRPVLSSFDPAIHEWCFDSMPPFLPANNDGEVFNSLRLTYSDKEYYSNIQNCSKRWYQEEHSNKILLRRLTGVIGQVGCF